MRKLFSSLSAADQEALGRLGSAMLALLGISMVLTVLAGTVGAENVILFPAGIVALLGLILAGWMYILRVAWPWVISTMLLPLAVLAGAQIGALIADLY